MSITKKKIQVDKNGREYILFRTDVYFTEYTLAVEIDEKNMLAETLFLRRKGKKHQKINLVVNLLKFMQVIIMIKIVQLVKYKYLSVNLKTDN